MFTRKTEPDNEKLDAVIDDLLESLPSFEVDSEEYGKAVDRLERLYALKDKKSERQISPDTMATVAGNLLGIALIVGHERAHLVTSRALDFVKKSVR